MRCMYCGKTITKDEAVFKDNDTPLCYNCNCEFGNTVSIASTSPRCSNCKVPLQFISDKNIIMIATYGSIFSKNRGGGPLKFKLYECPSCGEYRFFKNK